MVLQNGQPKDNWADLLRSENKEPDECGVANITSGKQTGWFRKMKNDSAKAKWLSDNNWRFFTVDFDDRTVFYSNSESTTKTVSCPIAFKDIVEVKLLDRKLQRGLTSRLFGDANEPDAGFCLITCDREIRLLCKVLDDARKWVSIFNAARKLGQGGPALVKSPSRGSMSTEPGSDEGPPQLSDTDSGEPGFKQEAGFKKEVEFKPYGAERAPVHDLPPWATPTPEPGSKPEVFCEPDFEDAFAALDALQDELGPVPASPEAPKVDTATAVKAAKAKRAEKKKGAKAPKVGYAETESPESMAEKSVARNLHKEMTAEDRNACDIALLQKAQMPLRSSKNKAPDDAPPLKATRPLKKKSAWDESDALESTPNLKHGWASENAKAPMGDAVPAAAKEDDNNSWDGSGDEKAPGPVAKSSKSSKSTKSSKKSKEISFVVDPTVKDDDPWDSDDGMKKPPVPKKSCGQRGLSEGKVDQGSWDDDEDAQAARLFKKNNKSLKKKQEVDVDDPTVGLDDLVDSVSSGKPVSVPIHEYVDGFQCTQCDFKVIRFTGFEWGPKAEYLFFRNYYGKPNKLKSRLNASTSCSAYCCQCAFKSVPSELELRDVKDGTRWKVIS